MYVQAKKGHQHLFFINSFAKHPLCLAVCKDLPQRAANGVAHLGKPLFVEVAGAMQIFPHHHAHIGFIFAQESKIQVDQFADGFLPVQFVGTGDDGCFPLVQALVYGFQHSFV